MSFLADRVGPTYHGLGDPRVQFIAVLLADTPASLRERLLKTPAARTLLEASLPRWLTDALDSGGGAAPARPLLATGQVRLAVAALAEPPH